MKKVKILRRYNKVKAPSEFAGVSFFEIVDLEINFYGKKIVSSHDTRILEDGTQIIIDGDGFIKAGDDLNSFAA